MPFVKKRRDEDYEGEGGRKYVQVPNFNPQEICQDLYDIIRNQKTEHGKLLCEPFIRVPKRRNEPDYYTTVNVPMDLLKIQHRLKSEEYEDVDDMIEDFNLMINNAKSFYQPDSSEYKQAVELQTLFEKSKAQLISQALGVAMETDDDVALTIDVPSQGEKFADDERLKSSSDGKVPASTEGNEENNKLNESGTQSGLLDESSRSGFSNVLSSGSDMEDEKNKSPGNEDKKRKIVKKKRRTNKDLTEEMVSMSEGLLTPASSLLMSQLDDDYVMIEQLFSSTVTACDDTHCFTDLFRVMPSRMKFPEYYQVIKEPMDLKTIAKKIQSSSYPNVDAMIKDFMLIISNAKAYNEPYSKIYKDATAMKKFLMNKKQELEQLRQSRSQRTRGRSLMQQQQVNNMSSAYASIKSDDDDDADDAGKSHQHHYHRALHKSRFERSAAAASATGAGSDDDGSDTFTSTGTAPHFETEYWHLYDSIKSYRNSNDQAICEPFLRLPSRRFYPDYYQEIKRPLSLVKIQKKIKNGSYPKLESLASDFNLVFDNAKQYNREDSRIYQDADTLQKVMRGKFEELKRSKEAAATKQHQSKAADDEATRRKRMRLCDDNLKKNLYALYNSVLLFKIGNRSPIDIFRTLPLRKEYPDYYQIIKQPIDMNIIELKIKHDKYLNLMSLSLDFELMFNNARQYNEETSMIYRDADVLERFMHSKLQSIINQSTSQLSASSMSVKVVMRGEDDCTALSWGNAGGAGSSSGAGSYGDGDAKKNEDGGGSRAECKILSSNSVPNEIYQKLYNTVRDYMDDSNRTLSGPFMKLPLKSDYPDYYNVITKPMDMQKILIKITTNQYGHVDDVFSDMYLMFNNACVYNEPNSQIFKDAIQLQKVCMDFRVTLNNEAYNELVSNSVQQLTQQLLLQIFQETVNFTDGEGRYYSDSIYEYSVDDDDDDNEEKKLFSLESIQLKLENGQITRLDCLQECLFKLVEHIRSTCLNTAQAYSDSLELARSFVAKRDELCCQGGVLLSGALSYTLQKLDQTFNSQQTTNNNTATTNNSSNNNSMESSDDVFAGDVVVDGADRENSVDEYEFNGVLYKKGDFVYIQSSSLQREPNSPPNIVYIEQLFYKQLQQQHQQQHQESVAQQQQQQMFLKGCWFLRPSQTFCHHQRKFIDNEVLKSEFKDEVPFDKVVGRCLVVHIKQYITHETQSVPGKDVYICESSYIGKKKEFRKLKKWNQPKNDNVIFTARPQPFVPARKVLAQAAATTLKSKNVNKSIDCTRRAVLARNVPDASDGCTYYQQQRVTNGCWVKIGDFVVVKTLNSVNNADANKPTIIKVEKIWSTETGQGSISGPLLLHPQILESQLNGRLFYRKEVLLSNRDVTYPFASVVQLCSVMGVRDYVTCRYTHITENDVYVCEFKFSDVDKSMKKTNLQMKHQNSNVEIVQDEVYFLKQPLVVVREQLVIPPVSTSTNSSANNIKLDTKLFEDESMDFCSSIADQTFNESSSSFLIGGDVSQSGSGDLNPATAGGASKKKKKVRTTKVRNITGYIVYAGECRKDIQAEFPDFNFGDISRAVGNRWKSLPKDQKEKYEEKARLLASDASLKIGDYSINSVVPSPGAESRSMSPNSSILPTVTNSSNNMNGGRMGQVAQNLTEQTSQPLVTQFNHQQSGRPLFVSLPPQPQRVIHSEAYLRYIRGMTQNSRFIGDCNKTLNATKPEASALETTKLPSHWLAQGPGHHGDVVSALWAMRDHMLKDAFNISKVLT
ncbi:hypothetical protein HELRODRAFT_194900 [Helobdella robusta]|uniref:Protein polybromo-1 n=1 Tax=Helobdella robusta TaxID=6412 RepID=T1FWJ6_HELRO|nr:hypothetical protein HELRODRAFT_194900 [Helobdella robusta]ESO11119.1 hypothetical protein HELRODRAFT_194900 [Helobdella robusta]